MPYKWTETPENGRVLRVWPHRSLPLRGFAWFIGATALMLALPLVALLGSVVLWGLLPFALAAIGGLWWAIAQSYRSGQTSELLTLTPDRISLTRRDPDRAERHWSANPYWIRATIRPGPVEDYLTLVGDHQTGREIELGAFLTAPERRDLQVELNRELARQRG